MPATGEYDALIAGAVSAMPVHLSRLVFTSLSDDRQE
jgi:hypothetical protein